MPRNTQGYTLLSLAITLVVIGLMVGSIVVAANMIRAARMQSVLSEVDVYKQTFVSFQDKYMALPGDMPNATSFWGTDAGCTNSAYTTTTHIATCNGDGNGHIAGYEMFRAWQQLANAGIVSGAYVGMSGSLANDYAIIGSNVPSSSLTPGGYTVYFQAPSDALGLSVYPGNYGHIIMFGKQVTNSQTTGVIMTPSETRFMDSKIDDGYPAFGEVLTSAPALASNANCTTSATPTSSTYNTSYTSDGCNMIFLMGF